MTAEDGRVKATEPNVGLPLSAGVNHPHATPIELFVPPVLLNRELMESSKLNCPLVRDGTAPFGITVTARVRLSILTPAPKDRPIVHMTVLPA